jgi:hypothetical protein
MRNLVQDVHSIITRKGTFVEFVIICLDNQHYFEFIKLIYTVKLI